MAVIYFQKQFIDESEAKVSVKTHALQYGTGIFEGIRSYYNEQENAHYVFRMEDHYKRMVQSGKIMFMDLGHSIDELCTITKELIQKNFTKTDIYIRPFAYKSEETVKSFNLKTLPTAVTIYTVEMGRYIDTSGLTAMTSSWRRVSDTAIPARAKIAGSYVNTALAKTESDLLGFGEAILLDSQGHVAEGSAENLFIIRNNTLITPPVSDELLQGITRDTIITLAKEQLHLPISERSIDRTELYQADEVFLCGTGAEVAPVVMIDQRIIGNGTNGPVTTKIKDIYYSLVHGTYNTYNTWLTKVTQ